MSAQSERITRQLKWFRDAHGEPVIFKGVTYRCFVEEVAGAHAGEQALPRAEYGIYIAAAVPDIFDFSPLDFAPTTSITAPKESDTLTRNNRVYIITAVDYENEAADTGGFFVYALCRIVGVP
jgi:hypothetical protein